MNTENIQAFFTKASTDENLAQQIAAIYEQAGQAAAVALAKLSENTSAPFTAEEYLAEQNANLSDKDLAGVAGGGNVKGWSFILGPCWTAEQRRFDITAEKK